MSIVNFLCQNRKLNDYTISSLNFMAKYKTLITIFAILAVRIVKGV